MRRGEAASSASLRRSAATCWSTVRVLTDHLLAPELAEEELRRAGFEIAARNDEFVEHRNTRTLEWLILARRPKDSAGK